MLLTAGLENGDQVLLTPLSSSKPPSGFPSLRHTKEAGVIQMKEYQAPSEKKQRDWLKLLLRESLGKLSIHFQRLFQLFPSGASIYHSHPSHRDIL